MSISLIEVCVIYSQVTRGSISGTVNTNKVCGDLLPRDPNAVYHHLCGQSETRPVFSLDVYLLISVQEDALRFGN